MTDSKFQDLLDRYSKAVNACEKARIAAEDEYKRRYGFYPADADDDTWIDKFQCGETGKVTVEEVNKGAVEYAKLKRIDS